MRNARFAVPFVTAWLLLGGAASASTPHTVAPGETLWSIAAADGLSPSALAAANGLSPDAHVVSGTTIQIPAAGVATATPAPAAAGPSAAPPPLGAHTVLPGETLSGIAARAGVSVRELAWMNGLDPNGTLVSGTALKLPAGASGGQSAAPAAAPTYVPPTSPSPTPDRVTSTDIGSIAASNGVPPSLAAAIGWQESGFNNAQVSGANARGVMQVTPGTWQWVQQNLASSPLDPTSSTDNVRAGVLYLRQLLRDTGGDPAQAAAAYYQGLGSLRAHGMLPSTRQYVDNVMALRGRFGGP
jgi:N-acetylmuramoyl-L-alanine amidase